MINEIGKSFGVEGSYTISVFNFSFWNPSGGGEISEILTVEICSPAFF